MKNVKKLLKKAMVFTVAASMLVGTPLTASAAGIRGVYSVSDGTGQIGENPDSSHTGTVTNTDTGTNSGVLKENDAKIIGIALDKDYVNAEKGVPEKLTATIVLDGALVNKGGDDSKDFTDKVLSELKKKIKWEVTYADGTTVKDNVAANKVLSIASGTVAGGFQNDKTVAVLNPRQGTKKNQEMIVKATIDGSYYFYKDENGNIVKEELKEGFNKVDTESYTATAKVSIKEYTDKLVFDEPMPTAYLKQTLDLNDYITRTPETANDEITWISTNTKVATVTAAGVVTFKKVNTKENADGELVLTADKDACQIIAVGEHAGEAKDTWDVLVEAGTPASKVVIIDPTSSRGDKLFANNAGKTKKADVDIKDDNDWEKDATVVMYAKVKAAVDAKGELVTSEADLVQKNGKYTSKTVEIEDGKPYIEVSNDGKSFKVKDDWKVTDTITWTSNKPAIVGVGKPEGANTTGADTTLYADGVGTAVITAKASSGKSDKLTVTVKATLAEIWIADEAEDEVTGGKLYSGKALQLYVGRNPKENKDAVKWSIAKETVGQKEVKNPNATINAKGVLTIKPKLDLSDDEYRTVTVVLEPKKAVKDAEGNVIAIKDEVTFTVEQSSIDGILVKDDNGIDIAEVTTTYNSNNVGKVSQVKKGAANTTPISVPKNRTYTAIVTPSKDVNGEGAYEDGADTLTWTTSNAKVASVEPAKDGTAKITANAYGTATITVSGVRAVNQTKSGVTSLKSASVIKTTFRVSVKQPVKTVTLNKPSVVLNEKTKTVKKVLTTQDQKVALKATLGPKGVGKKEAIHWSVKQTAGVDHSTALENKTALGLLNKRTGAEITSASISITLPQPKVGDVFEITARADSGASATSVVKIVEKTTSVEIRDAVTGKVFEKENPKPNKDPIKNTVAIKIGDSITMDPWINISTTKGQVDWHKAGTDNCESIVSYTVNKKGIVNIDQKTGEVYAIKDGKVTITAKTALGKSAKLTVEVSR